MEMQQVVMEAAKTQAEIMSAAAWLVPTVIFAGLAIWKLFNAYNR